jgi:hypothetical protein
MAKKHYKNRKKVEAYILEWIKKITKDENNINLYKEFFKSLSNEQFDNFMERLKNGDIIQIIVPPDSKADKSITVKNNLKLAKELGVDFYQHLIYGPSKEYPAKIKTPIKFLVVDSPLRRLRQTVEKGVSVSKNIKHIDMLTGQVTGESQASKITLPELQLLNGMGVKDILVEFLKFRGGDLGANRAMNNYLMHYGKASMNVLKAYAEGVVSTKTLKAYLNAIHLKVSKDNQL